MMLFGITSLWGVHPRQWLKLRWWLLGLAWVVLYAVSYFWSDDKVMWAEHLQVKLPFLLLPLSFGLLPCFRSEEWRAYTVGLAALMMSGAAWSTSFLWRGDTATIIDGYKYSQMLRTPVYNDHIAFSTAVAVTIAWIVYTLPMFGKRWQQCTLVLVCTLLGLYLHVLAAKTGLVALYIFLLMYAIFQLRQSYKRGLVAMLMFALGTLLAFLALPTLRERIGYSIVTWRSIQLGERHGIYSDAGRLFSYDIAVRSIVAHPLGGVGAGDVLSEMRTGYERWYPQVGEAQQLWPHNQWLTCMMAAGIPAAVLFTLWLVAPLRRLKRDRASAFFLTVWLMLLVPLMVDLFLEVQFGVAVFLIFLLQQRQALAMGLCNLKSASRNLNSP